MFKKNKSKPKLKIIKEGNSKMNNTLLEIKDLYVNAEEKKILILVLIKFLWMIRKH